MGISILIRGGDREERRLDFERSKVTIGSDQLCDITIESQDVAAEQAVLVQRADRLELFDVGEARAVLVNGQPFHHGEVRWGDEIWIGDAVLVLTQGAQEGVTFVDRGEGTVRASVPSTSVDLKKKVSPVTPVSPVRTEETRRLALLNEVGRLIRSIGRSENIFESILDAVFASAPVKRAFLGLRGSGGGRGLQVQAWRNQERGGAGESIEVSQTLVGKCLETGQAVLTSDAEEDPNFSLSHSIHQLRIKACICVPLVVEGAVIGLLYGDNREQPGSLSQEDLAYLNALASVAAVAVEKFRLLEEYDAKVKIDQALAIARSIHRNFLPSQAPVSDAFDIAGRSESCDATGGDYFDFFTLPGGRIATVIADVAGHGIGPALVMASVRASLRALIHEGRSLEELLSRLNDLIRGDIRDGRFVTLFFAVFDMETRTVRHIGAGHTPPLWFRSQDGSTMQIPSGGPPLGIMDGMRFAAGTEIPLDAGDVFLFTTDGVFEAENPKGDRYGMARLRNLLGRNADGTAEEIVEAVRADVAEFAQGREPSDDTTMVAVKIL